MKKKKSRKWLLYVKEKKSRKVIKLVLKKKKRLRFKKTKKEIPSCISSNNK